MASKVIAQDLYIKDWEKKKKIPFKTKPDILYTRFSLYFKYINF